MLYLIGTSNRLKRERDAWREELAKAQLAVSSSERKQAHSKIREANRDLTRVDIKVNW